MTRPPPSDNAFEQDKPGTAARERSDGMIEGVRRLGGVFVEAVRATRVAMVLTDPALPGNPIVFANQSFLDLTGYSMEEVLGQQPHFMNGPDTDPEDSERFRQILADDRDGVVETIQYAKGGRRFVAAVLLSAFKDEEGRTLHHFLTWTDITRRAAAEGEAADLKTTQAALRRSEEKYRTLFTTMDEAYAVVEVLKNEAGDWADFRFIEVNPAFIKHTGMPYPVGQTAIELLGSPNPRWARMYGQALDTGRPLRVEENEPTLDRIFDLNIFALDHEHNRVAVLFTDITDRKKSEQVLRESEERKAFLLQLSDALAPLGDAGDIQATTTRLLGEHLNADRIMYAEVEGAPGQERGTIRGQYVRRPDNGPAIIPFPRHFTFGQFGEHTMEARRRGQPLVVHDVGSDPKYSAAERAAWAKFNVAAAVVATLAKEGRLVAEFGVHSTTPRVWTDAEIALVKEVAERTWAAAERARAETALRSSEERQSFLLKLSDAVRPLADPADIQGETTRLLREQLHAGWCYYVDWDLDRKTGQVLRDSVREGLESLVGVHDVSDAADFLQLLSAGEVLAVRDYAGFERLPAHIRKGFVAPGFRSMMVAPLVKEGRLIASLLVGDTEIRDWSSKEEALLVEAAERTWAAVEQARAEAALRQSEQHSRVLLAELQHRVRNTLGVIRSIARRTAQTSDSVEGYASHLDGRLAAFARVQGMLTRSPERGISLRELVEDELVAHAAREGEGVEIDGDDTLLPPRVAERLSLAVHELATNSVKYGALQAEAGSLRVHWRTHGAGPDRRLRFGWEEKGVAIPPGERRSGFGTELLTRQLAYELKAAGLLDFSADGVRYALDVPLPSAD